MTKQATSIRLSETAERYIDEILKSHPIYDGNRTRAIEHALEYTVKNEQPAADTAPAARPARPKATTKEQER